MFFRHLPKALPAELCATLLATAQAKPFDKATVNYYGESRLVDNIRNNDRAEWDNPVLALELEDVLLHALGDDFPFEIDGQAYAATGSHFRLYRYRPGQYFKPHKDGSFKDKTRESLVTALFYLNDTDGGETVLMPYGVRQDWGHKAFTPRAGDVLLFEHHIWHEGRPVHSGEKLVLRTDLFYTGSDE